MKTMKCPRLVVLFALVLQCLVSPASTAVAPGVDEVTSNLVDLVVQNMQTHPEKRGDRTAERPLDGGDGLALLWFGLVGVLFFACWFWRDEMNLSAANRILETPEMTHSLAQDVIRRLNWLKERFRPIAEPKQAADWMRRPLSTLDHLNDRATEIAEYLGMRGVTFAVRFREMDANRFVCRNGDGRDGCVLIGLSPRLMGHREAILFALCREIMSTFIERTAGCRGKGADGGLVDVACAYFGLGRLALNGALIYRERVAAGVLVQTLRRSASRIGALVGSQQALAYDFCARMLGRDLGDEPDELKGLALAIFRQYRKELRKIGPLSV